MPRVTSKGQVTIPKPLRDRFGIQPGTEVEFVADGGTLRLRKSPQPGAIDRWIGVVELPTDVESFIREMREEAD